MNKLRFWISAFLPILIFGIANPPVFAAPSDQAEGGWILKIGGIEEKITSETLEEWVKIEPFLEIDPSRRTEIENVYSCRHKIDSCWLESTIVELFRTHKKDIAIADSSLIEKFVEDLSRRVNIDPIDAKFNVENDRVVEFSSSKEGLALKVPESASIVQEKIISGHLPNNETEIISLPFETVEPKIKNNNGLGIATLIGEGVSNFAGSPKNRIFNIKVATERFNGILIKPGEDFSFVNVLGPVDGEHGYLPELVIKKDKTEPEFGGGICQVSTTAFRAAIYSGLKITARRNHAYPVQYYNPQGMDATVYVPRPDLRFLNNTPAYILIQTKIEGTELKFQFYGTDDGRTTQVDGPRITERTPDGGLKAVFSQKVTDKDGNIIVNDVFNSSYDSPSKYPHPGQEPTLTKKPDDWTSGEWKKYKKEHGL